MRPTVFNLEETTIEKPEWKTQSNWCHWDQNPWIEPHFARIQALVAISNHTKTSGGFHCLPGFHQKFGAYAAAHLADRREGDLIDVADECLKQKLCKVTLRPGSLLIWDSRLPHGNWPNNDESFRMVFYMGCHVALQNAELQRRMKLLGSAMIPSEGSQIVLSDLGKRLFGQLDWEQKDRPENNKNDIISRNWSPLYMDLTSQYTLRQLGLV